MTRTLRSIPALPLGLIIAGIGAVLFIGALGLGLVLGAIGRAG